LELGVCINPSVEDSPAVNDMDELLIPTLNAIEAWNQLQAVDRNVLDGSASSVPSGKLDYETVLVHEIGHCIGLGHPNEEEFTAATDGANGVLELNAGSDGVRGSRDDLRGDDVNLHWFFKGINDPFVALDTVDQFTYSRDLSDLPSGHRFATMGSEEVAQLLGYPSSEAVMVQGTRSGLDQRALSYDDIAMVEFAKSGLDETAGTADDYELELKFVGFLTDEDESCDLMIIYGDGSGVAACSWNSVQIQGNHHRMNFIRNRFSNDVDWHYGQGLTATGPAVWLRRTASRSSVEEPGAQVRFTVRVTNGPAGPVSLTSLVDDVDGDLDGRGGCSLPQTLAANGSYVCSYTRRVEGNAGDVETSRTTATATSQADSSTATGSSAVSVEITDSVPAIELTRTATPANVPEPGRDVTFEVAIANLKGEPVPLTSLVDDAHGNLNGQGTCALATIPGNGTYVCSYDIFVGGVPGDTFTSTVTAAVRDDENNTAMVEQTTAVSVTAGAVSITKTVTPTVVDEPSGEVTYTIEIRNTSDLAIEITSIEDELFGELTGEGSCEAGRLPAGGVSECTFGSVVNGNGGEVESSFVTVSIIDGNGNADSAIDSSLVQIVDLPPNFSVEKTATAGSVMEPSGQVEFIVKVTNLGTENLVMTSLLDTEFGDLDRQGDCRGAWVIRVGIPYFCRFTATVSGNAGDTQSSAVVATLRDDDGTSAEGSSGGAPVSITNIAPDIAVQVTPSVTSLFEPGGPVDFTVRVENVGAESVELTSLVDGALGDLDGVGTCRMPQSIIGFNSYVCFFSTPLAGNAGDQLADAVSAVASDDEGTGVNASGGYSVTLLDALPSVILAVAPSVDEVTVPGAEVTYTVRVDNTSVEAVTLTALVDDLHGNVDGQGSCALPQTLGLFGFYECSYTVFVGGAGGEAVTATVTATAADDEANSAVGTGSSTVQVTVPADATDLGVEGLASPSPAFSGEPLTLTLTVSNRGRNPAEDVVLSSVLPGNTSLVSAPACGESTPGELTCDLGTIEADQEQTVTIELLVDGAFEGELTHTASVSSSTPEASPGDEEFTEVIVVIPAGSLIFVDGFESGDTSAWSALVVP
ncbi:MAG: hypothetical protein AAGM22_23315, partial [Acidobacteriota bacterium]